jgi:hypothetical protein
MVQESFCLLNAPALYQHADIADPKAIHQHGNWDGGYEPYQPLPQRCNEKVDRQESGAHQRGKAPETLAGLHHLQLEVAQIDDTTHQDHADVTTPNDGYDTRRTR